MGMIITIEEPAPMNIPAIRNIIFITSNIISLDVLPSIASMSCGILASVITYPKSWPAASSM